jgi:cytochrome c oxidase assembly factor CtaG
VPEWVRPVLCGTAVVAFLAVFVPPVWSDARRYEFVEAIRFSIFAVAVPALVVLGAPWRLLGLAARPTSGADAARPGPLDRVAEARRRHPEMGRAVVAVVVDMVVVVGWRTRPAVDAVSAHGALVALEAVTLVLAGVGLWTECVESPPLAPRVDRPKRIAFAAVAMWTIWVSAYVVGLSHTSVYPAFHHAAGRGLSRSADQELTTGVLWFCAICAFVPVIFWNLVAWLRTDEDPDLALHRIVREERRRGWAAGGADRGGRPHRA